MKATMKQWREEFEMACTRAVGMRVHHKKGLFGCGLSVFVEEIMRKHIPPNYLNISRKRADQIASLLCKHIAELTK